MFIKRIGLTILIAGAAVLALGIGLGVAQTPGLAIVRLEGRVYQGQTGQEPPVSQPLEGVLVTVYCSGDPYPSLGTPIISTTTNSEGWYGLDVDEDEPCEYFHIVETDPPDYSSVGATTVSGTVKGENWIQYSVTELLLGKQVLTGNKFWDWGWEPRYEDDFEDGEPDGWSLEQGWEVVPEGERHLLCGEGHRWAVPDVEGWVDSELTATLRVTSGTVHVNVRYLNELLNETDVLFRRYYVGFKEDWMYIRKQVGGEHTVLYTGTVPFDLGGWHDVRVRAEGTVLQVYLDGELRAEVEDDDEPGMFGGIALETLDQSIACLDDLRVKGPFYYVPPGYLWHRTGGPSGGLGYDVRIHPEDQNMMFVTDNPSGVNKSTDGGQTWSQRNISITTRTGMSNDEIPIFSLTIDPSSSNIIWIGTQDKKGIYRSDDYGESWEKRDNGVVEGDEISFRGFGVHPHNPDVVLGGAEIKTGIVGQRFDKTKGAIYRTTDGGLNWNAVWRGDNLVRFILIDYTDPMTMYASTGIFDREGWDDGADQAFTNGVLKSTDGGDHWVEINTGIPITLGYQHVGYLEMHPEDPHTLFAASGNNTWGNGGVFRTTDAGLNWTAVLTGDIFTLVTFSPSNPMVVYAGSAKAIYRSDDGGDTWHKFWKPAEWCWGPPGIRAGVPIGAVVDPDDPMTIFVNNYQGGNFKSTDGGKTWEDASQGYTGAKLTGIAINRDFPAQVYVSGRSGPFRSRDGGGSWSGLAYNPALRPEWYDVAMNPDNPRELLLADEHEGIIYKSVDGGGSWFQVFDHPVAGLGSGCNLGPRLCNDGFKALAYAPSNPQVIYGGMCVERRMVDGFFKPARSSYGIYKSTDGGETWGAVTQTLPLTATFNVHDLAVDPTNPNVVYAATWKTGLFKSTNGGASWTSLNAGLPSLDARSVTVDPNNGQTVYVGLGEGKGIYKSTNGGGVWNSINAGLNVVCPSYLQTVGEVSQGMSLERMPDPRLGGVYAAGSMGWTAIWDMVVDPSDSQIVYAADHHSGVYVTTNGGGHWMPINDGLTMRAVVEMDISDDGQVVYAATWGGGVYRLGDVTFYVYLPLVLRE